MHKLWRRHRTKVNGVIKYMVVDNKTKMKLRDLDDTDGQEER